MFLVEIVNFFVDDISSIASKDYIYIVCIYIW